MVQDPIVLPVVHVRKGDEVIAPLLPPPQGPAQEAAPGARRTGPRPGAPARPAVSVDAMGGASVAAPPSSTGAGARAPEGMRWL